VNQEAFDSDLFATWKTILSHKYSWCLFLSSSNSLKMCLSSKYSTDQKKPNRESLTQHVVSVPHAFLFPFRICSISIPYLFLICSVLLCSCFVSIPSVSVLGTTRSEEPGFRELVYKIRDTHLHFMKWVKTVNLWKNTNSKLKFSWWKYESRNSKNTGRWYCNFKAS